MCVQHSVDIEGVCSGFSPAFGNTLAFETVPLKLIFVLLVLSISFLNFMRTLVHTPLFTGSWTLTMS